MNAAIPPVFCTSAIACSAIVVLPDDSGPYTSTIRPFGYPPIPRAESIANDPEDTASTLIGFSEEIS